ncbi:unnamed protein product [Zymoseptoria tritici ST99CH_3D7]|uniref:Uncharacterized protein n=1 Tax=Zymoseptoria tritici (strain ST99CH_3D7) TaxID=1276538 RepID=A0A1X7RNI1_ZYMT9|nr:unnamed protein product [Zymoseptoria tritici ST99CH_3D7]
MSAPRRPPRQDPASRGAYQPTPTSRAPHQDTPSLRGPLQATAASSPKRRRLNPQDEVVNPGKPSGQESDYGSEPSLSDFMVEDDGVTSVDGTDLGTVPALESDYGSEHSFSDFDVEDEYCTPIHGVNLEALLPLVITPVVITPAVLPPAFRLSSGLVDMTDRTPFPVSLQALLLFMTERLLSIARSIHGSFLPDFTAAELAEDFHDVLNRKARRYLDQCIKKGQPWDLEKLLALLPVGTDSTTRPGKDLNGVYLIRVLRDFFDGRKRSFIYGGSQYSAGGDVDERIRQQHCNPVYRSRKQNVKKNIYQQWDGKNSTNTVTIGLLLVQSLAETARKTQDYILFCETLVIALLCGYDKTQLQRMPQLLPTSLLCTFANAQGLDAVNAETSITSLVYHIFGAILTNHDIPMLDEVHKIRNLPYRMMNSGGNATDGFSAPVKIHNPKKAESNCCQHMAAFRTLYLPIDDMAKYGYSSERPNTIFKLLLADSFTEDNFAGVSSDFVCDELPDVGRIQFCITFKNDDDEDTDYFLQLGSTHHLKNSGLKNSDTRIMRNAVDAQSLWEYVSSPTTMGDWSDNPFRVYNDYDSADKVFHDVDRVAKIMQRDSAPPPAAPNSAFMKSEQTCKAPRCRTHFLNGSGLLTHLHMKMVSGKPKPWPPTNTRVVQCLDEGYDGIATTRVSVLTAHNVPRTYVDKRGYNCTNKAYPQARSADDEAKKHGEYRN